MSIDDRRKLANSISPTPIFFSWDVPRTREGFYRYRNGVDAAVKRVLAFAPYADLLWAETKEPDLKQAALIASKVHEKEPNKDFVYNLSPSFNWDAHNFDEPQLKSFVWDLAKLGFCVQLISLAGIHTTAVSMAELAKGFRDDGMLAYVQTVQRKEREMKVDVLTHQKWSGVEYLDGIIGAIKGGSSSSKSMGEGSTESQF